MIQTELLADDGVAILKPEAPLTEADFHTVGAIVDPYIEKHGKLRGIMIQVDEFPGWKDFAAFTTHMRFIKDHHQHIAKVAAVSDSGFLTIAPDIARHFLSAEVKHFAASDVEVALAWLKS